VAILLPFEYPMPYDFAHIKARESEVVVSRREEIRDLLVKSRTVWGGVLIQSRNMKNGLSEANSVGHIVKVKEKLWQN
jgi:hypothetical protein